MVPEELSGPLNDRMYIFTLENVNFYNLREYILLYRGAHVIRINTAHKMELL